MSAGPRLVEEGELLVLSYFFPPMSAGPAFVVDALLRRLDLSGVTILTGDPERYPLHLDPSLRTAASVHQYDVPGWWPEEDRTLRIAGRVLSLRLRAIGNVAVALRVAFAATAFLRRPEVRGVLVIYPKQHFLLAGYLASLVSRKPLLVYFMDVYAEGLPRGRRVGRLIERLVGRRASLLFAMSESHREHLEERLRSYGVKRPRVVELAHPYEEDAVDSEESTGIAGTPSIVFTGAIYDAQAEGIRRLIEALACPELGDLDPRLHLLTQSSLAELSKFGVEPSQRVLVQTATRAAARAAQRAADVLFLPIAFDAKPHVRRTASPSKMPEYLAAGVPILVYAPPDSYLARYASEHGFAEVVTEPDAVALARALRRLTTDSLHIVELTRLAAETLRRHRSELIANELRRGVADAIADAN